MPRKKQTRGVCVYCDKEMTRGGLARHLKTCSERQKIIAAADAGKQGLRQNIYHLQVQDAWGGDFWLHLEMNGESRLKDLDSYLRAIWLECCGHLSAFLDWWRMVGRRTQHGGDGQKDVFNRTSNSPTSTISALRPRRW